MRTPVPATIEVFRLAEGPVWDRPRRRVLWVDIVAGYVFEGSLHGDAITVTGRRICDEMVGRPPLRTTGPSSWPRRNNWS